MGHKCFLNNCYNHRNFFFSLYFSLYKYKQNYKIFRILVMQDWTSLTQAQNLGQSFAIKNILLFNRVEIEVSNDTA